jgi:retron-type reverse transcriptase
VQEAQRNINEGYQHVIDIDLKSFFDQVDHAILLELIHRKVRCRLTMRLAELLQTGQHPRQITSPG